MPATKARTRALGINNREAVKRTFAARLEYALEKRDYTPSQFADVCGLAHSTVNRYLTAQKLPSTDALRVMVAVLGVTSDWLIVLSKEDRTRINAELSEIDVSSMRMDMVRNVPVRRPARPVPSAEAYGVTPQ